MTGVQTCALPISSRNFHMLGKITTGKKVEKFDCLSIAEVVDMDVEVANNDEFMTGGGCVGKI